MKNEHTQQLLNLVSLYPDLDIITATHADVIGDDCDYWCAEIKEVRLDYFYHKDERWYAGEEDIKDNLSDELSNYKEYENLSSEEFKEKVNERFKALESEGKIKTAIIIYISI